MASQMTVSSDVTKKGKACSKSPIKGQFKATRIWKDLVGHLYENVSMKKRRVLMRSRTDCFTGGNAVDTMLSYVRENRTRFPNTTMVTRENIVRLCQSFVDTSVIECVNAGEDSERRIKFEDSSSRLYRFNSEKKREFMKDKLIGSPPKLQCIGNRHSIATEVELLPAKFSSLLTAPRSASSLRRHRAMPSPFSVRSRKSNVTDQCGSSSHGDDDGENHPPVTRRTPKLKRSRSFVGFTLKRSSSNPDVAKRSASSESDSGTKRQSSGDRLTRGKLRLSQRMSLTRKSLRRMGHSSYNLQPLCVIQNPAADRDDFNPGQSSRQETKGQRIIPDNQSKNVQVVSSRLRKRKLTQQEISKAKRECVRVRLLQIVEVPFVETLVFSPTLDKKIFASSQKDNICVTGGHGGTQYSELVASYNSEDLWISRALSVLRHIPDCHHILRKHSRLSERRKRTELYFAIAEHYKSAERPLVDENYNGVAQAIISLLVSRPVDRTMEATQLFVHLIPDARLAELEDLCMFLHAVSNQKETKLVVKGNNQALVIDTFTPALLRLPDFDAMENGLDGCKGLVRFMVQHCHQVFKLPATIETAVQAKIEHMEQGETEAPPLAPASSYCSIISGAEYQEQSVSYTNKQIRELFGQILSDDIIPAKKKKDLIKKLQKQHPEIFGVTKDDSDAVFADQSEKRVPVQQTCSIFSFSRPKRAGSGVSKSPRKRPSTDPLKSQLCGSVEVTHQPSMGPCRTQLHCDPVQGDHQPPAGTQKSRPYNDPTRSSSTGPQKGGVHCAPVQGIHQLSKGTQRTHSRSDSMHGTHRPSVGPKQPRARGDPMQVSHQSPKGAQRMIHSHGDRVQSIRQLKIDPQRTQWCRGSMQGTSPQGSRVCDDSVNRAHPPPKGTQMTQSRGDFTQGAHLAARVSQKSRYRGDPMQSTCQPPAGPPKSQPDCESEQGDQRIVRSIRRPPLSSSDQTKKKRTLSSYPAVYI